MAAAAGAAGGLVRGLGPLPAPARPGAHGPCRGRAPPRPEPEPRPPAPEVGPPRGRDRTAGAGPHGAQVRSPAGDGPAARRGRRPPPGRVAQHARRGRAPQPARTGAAGDRQAPGRAEGRPRRPRRVRRQRLRPVSPDPRHPGPAPAPRGGGRERHSVPGDLRGPRHRSGGAALRPGGPTAQGGGPLQRRRGHTAAPPPRPRPGWPTGGRASTASASARRRAG